MKRFTAFMRKPPSQDEADTTAAGARSDETKESSNSMNERGKLADTLGKLSLTAEQHASSSKPSGDDLDAQLGRLKLEGPLTKPTIPPHLVPLPPSPDLEEREPLVWPAPPPPSATSSTSLKAKSQQEQSEDGTPTEEGKPTMWRRTPKKKQSASATLGGAAEEREAAASPVASMSAPKPSRASPRLKERLASPTPSTSRLAHDFSDLSAEEDAEGETDDEYFPEATIPSTGGRRPSKDVEVVTSTDAKQRPRRERMESPVPLSPPGAGQAPPSPPPEARRGSPTFLRSRQQPLAATPPPPSRSFAPPPPSAAQAAPAPALVPRMRAPARPRLSDGVPSPPGAPAPASPPPPPALARSFAPPPLAARRSPAAPLAASPPPPSGPAPALASASPLSSTRSKGFSPFSLFGSPPTGRSSRRVGAGGMGGVGSTDGGTVAGMLSSGPTFGARMSSPPFVEGSYSQSYSQAPAFASYAAPQASYSAEPFNSFTSLEEPYARFDRSTTSLTSDLFGFTDSAGDDSFGQSTTDDFSTLLAGENGVASFGITETLSAEEATYVDTLTHSLAEESPAPAAEVASESSFAEEQVDSLSSSYDFAEAWTKPPLASTSTSFLSSSDFFAPSPPEGSFSSPPSTLDSRSPSFPSYPDATLPSISSTPNFPFSVSSSSLSKNLADASDEELQRELERRKLERELAQIVALSPPMDNTVNPAHMQLPSPPTTYDNQPYDSMHFDPNLQGDILVQPLPPLSDLDAVYPSITSSQRSSTPNARPFTHQSRASRPTPLSRPSSSTSNSNFPSSRPQVRDLLDCYEYIPSETNPARGQYVCRICKDKPLEPGKKRKMGEYSGTRGAPSSIATRAWGHWDKYHGGL